MKTVLERRWAILRKRASGAEFIPELATSPWEKRSILINRFTSSWQCIPRYSGMNWRQLKVALGVRCVRVEIRVSR